MTKDKSLLNFVVDKNLLKRLDDFRFRSRFPSRAGAIKWLLDWALKQKPILSQPEPPEPVPLESAGEVMPRHPPALAKSTVTHAPVKPIVDPVKPVVEPVKPALRVEQSLESAIQALKDQGYEVGDTAVHHEGQMRVVVRSKDRSALVNFGQELQDLAAGRLTLAEITARRGGIAR